MCHANLLATNSSPSSQTITADDHVLAMAERHLVMMNSYCVECDIQFTSHKNYAVHKQIYCNTRRVQSSRTIAHRPKSPVIEHITNNDMAGAWNLMQPSPLILVPCSYVPGRGLVPASNIMFQNSEELMSKMRSIAAPTAKLSITNANGSSAVIRNSIATISSASPTHVAEKAISSSDSEPSASKVVDVEKNNVNSEVCSEEASDGPLDLRVTKEPPKKMEIEDCEKENFNIMELNDKSAPNDVKLKVVPKSETLLEGASPGMPILVKQGVSNCAECNIVFYKHENYLAHKRFYCSSRNEKLLPLSVEDKNSSSKNPAITYSQKDQAKHFTTNPLIQFFCVPCGIKFTSIKNLQAHQTYYCPKREIMAQPSAASETESPPSSPSSSPINTAFTCMSCKNVYSSELSLRKHLCSIYSPKKSGENSPVLARGQTDKQSNALRCIVCGYRGHTLRGMKSHVRGHMSQFENAPHILEDDINAFVVHEKSDDGEKGQNLSLKLIPANGHTEFQQQQFVAGDLGYSCDFCSYTSSYRGNVVRHKRLVHKDKLDEMANNNDDNNELKKCVTRSSASSSSDESTRTTNNNASPPQKNFCNSCRISFSYLPSYMAHKQFYCSASRTAAAEPSRLVEEQAAL